MKWLEKLHAQPEHHRERIAIAVAVTVTLIIFVIWVASLSSRFQKVAVENGGSQEAQPVRVFSRMFRARYEDLRAQNQDRKQGLQESLIEIQTSNRSSQNSTFADFVEDETEVVDLSDQ